MARSSKTTGGYVVPTDARAQFRRDIQRANRRILANIQYIKDNNIRDVETRQTLAFDFYKKRTWATKKSPLSASTRFDSEADYKKFMQFIERWAGEPGQRGDFAAAPENLRNGYKDSIYQAINGLVRDRGISLEEWGGDLPPALREKIDNLSLTQMRHFFNYIDPTGIEEEFDSDQVSPGSVEDLIDYMEGRIGALEKFYPKAPKKTKSRRRKK